MTIPEIIDIAKNSQWLSSVAIGKGGLYGGGEDLRLPRKLYCVRKNVEYFLEHDPTNTTLYETSRFLYSLCAQYLFKAAAIAGAGGSVAPVIPDDTDCSGVVFITAADFESNGKTVYRPDWDGKALQIFWNNINRFIIPPEWGYVAGGGFEILIPTDFDAKNADSDCQFMVFVGCLSPGALFVPSAFPINEYIIVDAGAGTTYTLIWSAYYQNKYGVGSFTVYQDDGDGVWYPTAIQPTSDSDTSPSQYYFPVNDLRTKIIFN